MEKNSEEHENEHEILDESTDEHSHHEAPDAEAEKSEVGGKPVVSEGGKQGKHHQLWRWAKTHKKISIPAAAVLLLVILGAIPFTRYAIAGLFWKQTFPVAVVDAQTGKPVSNATVELQGVKVLTDNQGKATPHVKAGGATLAVSKQYYKSSSPNVTVPIMKAKSTFEVKLQATGRQVPITVKNKITGKPLANAAVSAAKSHVLTDAKGQAIIVLPIGNADVDASVTTAGYVTASVKIKVTAAEDVANTFQITPAGKVYFLSNKSGKIDVVKTNLDGTDRQTVLAGTGSEEPNQTVLLASTDWKYLALQSKRDGGANAKLFVIDTSNDQLLTMDEGDANFNISGWDGHTFVYSVSRNGYSLWQPKAWAVKAYDAESKKIATLDESSASGTNATDFYSESFGSPYIVGGEVVYTKNVQAAGSPQMTGKSAALMSVQPDGSAKKTIKSFTMPLPSVYYNDLYINVSAIAYEPKSLRFQANANTYGGGTGFDQAVYTYEDGQAKADASITDIYGSNGYPTFLASPSGKQTFWSEPRDGKNTLFVGDDEGKNGKQVASVSDYQTYGWYTDSYVLLSKNRSELYIMPVAGGTPIKITDYFRPGLSFPGYGGGYGGI